MGRDFTKEVKSLFKKDCVLQFIERQQLEL